MARPLFIVLVALAFFAAPRATPAQGSEAHPLVGEPAPGFALESLEGGKAEIESHNGKEIVILDFWATWCGPCVKALPVVAEVAAAYREKGVVLYAVNEQEGPEGIRTFLERQNLKLNVALDRDGKVGRLYAVEGIPQTVIIDKAGVIAAVHVGYSPAIKQMLARDLDAILAGKSPGSKTVKEPELDGLELAWRFEGRWSGVAADGARVIALSGGGAAVLLDARGQRVADFKIERGAGFLRAANLGGDTARELIAFEAWGPSVSAADATGAPLWRYPGGQGIDDVWAADLDGDELDEVIIGYNGSTGLHVLGADGALRWKTTAIASVWHVAAGDVLGDSAPEVIAASASGEISIFDAVGKPIGKVDPGIYATMVRAARATEGKAVIFAGGTRRADEHEAIVALNADGMRRWELEAGDQRSRVDALSPSPDGKRLAASMRGGRLLVIDAESGKLLASANGDAKRSEVTWLAASEDQPPLVVVTATDGIRAYRVVPGK